MKKVYIGDGVYAMFTHAEVVLTTENGIETTNTIYLEWEQIGRLMSECAAWTSQMGAQNARNSEERDQEVVDAVLVDPDVPGDALQYPDDPDVMADDLAYPEDPLT